VHKRRGLEGMVGSLGPQVVSGQAAQLRVHCGDEFLTSGAVAVLPVHQQRCDLLRVARHTGLASKDDPAYRTTLTDPSNPAALVNTIRNMGMPLYFALPPTGYYITADKWMNSSALVDRLNFAYQLTSSKFANQKFDAAKVVALGLMSEQTLPSEAENVEPGRQPHSGFKEMALTQTTPTAAPTTSAGTELALHVLESTLVGGTVSEKTNQLIHQQIAQATEQNMAPAEMLNLLTALVMGSPEFQLR